MYWTSFRHNEWNFRVAATSQGLCCVEAMNRQEADREARIKQRFPEYVQIQSETKMQMVVTGLRQYLQGMRKELKFPLDLRGTSFQLQVWHALSKIPYGQTRSYSEIAQLIRKPSSARAVGAAIGANPILIIVPCHRVIGKNGALTGYRGGLQMKTNLLQLEHALPQRLDS